MSKHGSFFVCVMMFLGVLVSCGKDAIEDTASVNPTDAELRELAHRYIFERHKTHEEDLSLLHTVENLSADDSYRFFEMVHAVQIENAGELTLDEQRVLEMSRAMNDYARERGVNRLRLFREEAHEALVAHFGLGQDALDHLNAYPRLSTEPVEDGPGTEVIAACGFGYATCSTVSYTSTAWGASCGSGCINGSSYDRFSNEMCELGACDHRIFYPSASLKNSVDGETSAADCVILYYGGIISRYSGGYTQLGYGIAGPAYCGILWSVSEYLRDNTQVF